MKIKINHLLIPFFFALFFFTSCQDEISEIENPNDQETIVPDSALANLMSRTAANFGAADDILDGASCFSVELPVTIELNDITIIIETEAGLEQLEDLLNDVSVEEDELDFLFPITIIFSDYSQIVIENEDQLQTFIDQCIDNENEVIECADFVYPISFSVFNAGFNLVDTVIIENDEALYIFLDELEDNENALIVSLNFPITIAYTNGDTIEVTSNDELADAIDVAEQFCDDDSDDCLEDEVALNLVACPWVVYLYSNNDLENLDGPLNFTFSTDGNVVIDGIFENPYTTTWELNTTDEGLVLHIESLYYYEAQLGNWLVVECDNDDIRLEYISIEGTGMFLERNCEDDLNCSITAISSILQECPWDFTNATGNFDNYQMIFHNSGDLQITEGETTSAIGGEWNLTSTDNGIVLTFSELTAFQQDLGGEWLIIECDDDRIVLSNGDQTLVLEQDCEGDNDDVFNCFGDFEIVECDQPNNVPIYNLNAGTIGLVDCNAAFIPSFHTTIADAENNTNAIVDTEAYGTLVAQVYLRIEAESGNFEIFTIYLNLIECNYFECFENRTIEVCDDDGAAFDGLYAFDLEIIYDCPEDNVVISFHMFISDAEASVDALVSPVANFTNPQTIYARVELAGDSSIYEIFEIELIVIDCTNNSNCTEEDIDGILTECIWNAVNYNGSDNLMEYNFNFEPNSQIVVIYTSEIVIDATWTTSQSDEGVIVTFSNVAGPNIQAITGEWLVVECEEDRLELYRENDILVLERNCN